MVDEGDALEIRKVWERGWRQTWQMWQCRKRRQNRDKLLDRCVHRKNISMNQTNCLDTVDTVNTVAPSI